MVEVITQSNPQIIRSSEINLESEPYILKTEIEGLAIVKRPRFGDTRGSFQEKLRTPDLEAILGHPIEIKQTQISTSTPNVLRGIHAETQAKLITPLTGKILAVLVDLRPTSETFKKYVMLEVDNTVAGKPYTSFAIDEGIGNSFYVYPGSPEVLYDYAVTGVYDPNNKGRGVRFDDPTLDIPWPTLEPDVSDRDREMPSLEEFVTKYYPDA